MSQSQEPGTTSTSFQLNEIFKEVEASIEKKQQLMLKLADNLLSGENREETVKVLVGGAIVNQKSHGFELDASFTAIIVLKAILLHGWEPSLARLTYVRYEIDKHVQQQLRACKRMQTDEFRILLEEILR